MYVIVLLSLYSINNPILLKATLLIALAQGCRLMISTPSQARILWKRALRKVLELLRVRKVWAALGESLKKSAPLFAHLERRKGKLTYKK